MLAKVHLRDRAKIRSALQYEQHSEEYRMIVRLVAIEMQRD